MKNNVSAKALEFYSPAMMRSINKERHEIAEELLLNSMAHVRSSLIALKSRCEYDIGKFHSLGGEIVKGDDADIFILGQSSLEKMKKEGITVRNCLHAENCTIEDVQVLLQAALADSDLFAYDRWISRIEQLLGEFQDYDAIGGAAYA